MVLVDIDEEDDVFVAVFEGVEHEVEVVAGLAVLLEEQTELEGALPPHPHVVDSPDSHAVRETAARVLVFVEGHHQVPLVQKVLLLQHLQGDHGRVLPILCHYADAAFVEESDKLSRRFKDLLCCEYFLVLYVSLSSANSDLHNDVYKQRLLLSLLHPSATDSNLTVPLNRLP